MENQVQNSMDTGSMSGNIYVYVHVYTHIHTYIYIYIHTRVYIYIHTYTDSGLFQHNPTPTNRTLFWS